MALTAGSSKGSRLRRIRRFSTRVASSSCLKKHFRRYTPEVVEEVCGVPQHKFLEVAQSLCDNSGRERTSAICYSVGWTQHTVGVPVHKDGRDHPAAARQHRPARRRHLGAARTRVDSGLDGHSTLYNILPGYLPMPHADAHPDRAAYLEQSTPSTSYWGRADAYLTSLLKAWWGRGGNRTQRFLLRPPAAAHGRSLHLPDDAGDEGRRGEGLLPARGESRGRLGERKAAQARYG